MKPPTFTPEEEEIIRACFLKRLKEIVDELGTSPLRRLPPENRPTYSGRRRTR